MAHSFLTTGVILDCVNREKASAGNHSPARSAGKRCPCHVLVDSSLWGCQKGEVRKVSVQRNTIVPFN